MAGIFTKPIWQPAQEANALVIDANSAVNINSRHPLEIMEKSRFSDRLKKNKYLNTSPTFGLKSCLLMVEQSFAKLPILKLSFHNSAVFGLRQKFLRDLPENVTF